jgi:hypothetical protein
VVEELFGGPVAVTVGGVELEVYGGVGGEVHGGIIRVVGSW